MKLKLSRSVHLYYTTILLLLIGSISWGINNYWDIGPGNAENLSAIFEASSLIEGLENKNELAKIRELAATGKARDAISAMDKLDRDIKRLNYTIPLEIEYTSLEKSLSGTKAAINGFLSFPSMISIIVSLRNKVTSFENFVANNNWRTLTRMSRRIKVQLLPQRVKSAIFFSYPELKKLKHNISKNITVMRNITTSSLLSKEDKNFILIKLKNLKVEMKMLSNYLIQMKKFQGQTDGFETQYKSWLNVLRPEISIKKIELEKRFQFMFLSLGGLVAFIMLALIVGFFVYKKNLSKIKNVVEKTIINAVNDGLLPANTRIKYEFSQDFQDQMEKFREYIHKRMSFGSIFQDATPFSAILLDSNLNLVWGNSLFFENWGMNNSKINHGSINWDYLQRFTNLGENDPIIAALNEKMAGIYQIQVRIGHNDESLPYEMYVSPVESYGQSRIMIFFYPLRSLEETIADQSKSIVGPVSRVLESLSNDNFTPEFQEKIEKDFQIAGIEEIHRKFIRFNEFVTHQKNGLIKEIELLEDELYDKLKLITDLKDILAKKEILHSTSINKLQETKNSVVETVGLRNEVEQLYDKSVNIIKTILSDGQELLNQSGGLQDVLDDNIKAIGKVHILRGDFKELLANINDSKQRLIQSLDQALIFKNTSFDEYTMDQTLGKIRMEARGFEKVLNQLGQLVTKLDVSLSKVELVTERNCPPDINSTKSKFIKHQQESANDIHFFKELSLKGQESDHNMVASLRDLMKTFIESKKRLVEADDLIQGQKLPTQHPVEAGIRPKALLTSKHYTKA